MTAVCSFLTTSPSQHLELKFSLNVETMLLYFIYVIAKSIILLSTLSGMRHKYDTLRFSFYRWINNEGMKIVNRKVAVCKHRLTQVTSAIKNTSKYECSKHYHSKQCTHFKTVNSGHQGGIYLKYWLWSFKINIFKTEVVSPFCPL